LSRIANAATILRVRVAILAAFAAPPRRLADALADTPRAAGRSAERGEELIVLLEPNVGWSF